MSSARIGSIEHRGISGGEARRVSIGIELVASPDVLVLDEPTSGLDSVTAARLIKLLKNLSEEGKTTIIASIHQPSSALYHSFDQVILLAQGKQLYFGNGRAEPARWFKGLGRECPEGYNVADHLLEIASGPLDGLPTGNNSKSQSENGSRDGRRGDMEEDHLDLGLHNDTEPESPFAEKNGSGLSYPPSPNAMSLSQFHGHDVPSINGTKSGQSTHHGKGKGWWIWPRSHCVTTFLTQLEILSGREWRNLKRSVV